MKKENIPFGAFIHALRLNKKLTLREAGEELGISFVYISEIEVGKKIPSEKIMRLFSRYYSIPLIELKQKADEQRLLKGYPSMINSSSLELARFILKSDLKTKQLKDLYTFTKTITGDR